MHSEGGGRLGVYMHKHAACARVDTAHGDTLATELHALRSRTEHDAMMSILLSKISSKLHCLGPQSSPVYVNAGQAVASA